MNTATRMMRLVAAAACAAAVAGGCNEEADRSPCDDIVAFDGADYCIVIEEGFLESDCPDEYPEGRDFGDVVVCTDADAVPDELEEELVRLGYLEAPVVCPDEEDPDVQYASTDPEVCASLDDLTCPDGATPFDDACGCGCIGGGIDPPCEAGETRRVDCNDCVCTDGAWACDDNDCSLCPDPDDPDVTYASDDPAICMVADLAACPEGTEFFDNYCGCGCVGDGAAECTDGDTRREECNDCVCVDGMWACDDQECPQCLDEEEPGVTYYGFSEEECALIDFDCGADQEPFGNWCGCGCIDVVATDCTDGETRRIDCNECVCVDGSWECTTEDCTGTCVEACGVGCPAPDYMLCGEDGTLYCNECEMGCYDVAESDDPSVCVDCPTADDPGIVGVVYASTDLTECALIDFGCPPNSIGFENQCGCGCVEWDAPQCATGETRTDGCVSCSCSDGYWDCDASACETTEACLETCSDECAPVDAQLCGANGGWYCDDCELLCYGVEGARGNDVCDRCATPDGAESVAWRLVAWPDTCLDIEFRDMFTTVYASELEFQADNPCDAGSPDVDWSTERLARFVFAENPDASVRDVALVDGTVTAFMEGDVYCGGAPPTSTAVLVAIPIDGPPVDTFTCVVGTCGHGPLPP